MVSEQEQMQFLGFFGIFKESFKIIISWKKIFAQITLTLILPLTFILLAQIQTSYVLFRDILRHLDDAIRGTKKYKQLSQTFSSEKITYSLIMTAFQMITLIIYLVLTVAVVYTIASVYTGRELTFKKVMSVVPKVFARPLITFLCIHVVFSIYFLAVVVMLVYSVNLPENTFGDVFFYVIFVIVIMVFVYMTLIWLLASMVSVLERSCGFKAMTKSIDLIKGKHVVAVSIFFVWNMSFIFILCLFESLVVEGNSLAWKKVGFSVLCTHLLLIFFLFGLVVQTILYLVCKSYHHESIDKGDLPSHL